MLLWDPQRTTLTYKFINTFIYIQYTHKYEFHMKRIVQFSCLKLYIHCYVNMVNFGNLACHSYMNLKSIVEVLISLQ
jgi:hypothetical protein